MPWSALLERSLPVEHRCSGADPPRHVAGGASLGRVRPLTSLVDLAGTACSGPMPNGSFLRRAPACADVRRSDLREPSPHPVTRVRRHRAWAGRVPSCRAMSTNALTGLERQWL